jgi:hypothetical protein
VAPVQHSKSSAIHALPPPKFLSAYKSREFLGEPGSGDRCTATFSACGRSSDDIFEPDLKKGSQWRRASTGSVYLLESRTEVGVASGCRNVSRKCGSKDGAGGDGEPGKGQPLSVAEEQSKSTANKNRTAAGAKCSVHFKRACKKVRPVMHKSFRNHKL